MGTRGAVGFRLNDQDKVKYNHHDSYPDGLGKTVVDFIIKTRGIDLKPFVECIRLVTEDKLPTPMEINRYSEFFRKNVGRNTQAGWYSLLREAQGKLEPYLNGLDVMIDSHEFLTDSLFCEFAYIINLDTNELEFYKGFNKDPNAPGRYAALHDDDGDNYRYYGVRLIKTWPLNRVDDNTLVEMKASPVPDAPS